MSRAGLAVFDETIQISNLWLKELNKAMGWRDRRRAYRLLRATLHALRDRLPAGEVADLGAQLPLLLRGIYYEGWRPSRKPLREHGCSGFIDEVREPFRNDLSFDPEAGIRAVFHLLEARISAGEIADIRHVLPKPVRDLWPDASPPAAA